MHRRLPAFLLLALLFPGLAAGAPTEVSNAAQVTALAVAETTNGFTGTAATVEARAMDGTGRVFLDTKPLAQADMQQSARLAARVAATSLGLDWTRYDFLLEFSSRSTVIGGPSAGAVMGLAMVVALADLTGSDWTIDPTVAATGTINPDGTIGPVGGIPEKAEGAQREGIRVFLFPAGQEVTRSAAGATVDMGDHCRDLAIQCRGVATLDELVLAATGIHLERPSPPIPDTRGYADILVPSVPNQVSRLEDRVTSIDLAGLTDDERGVVQASLDTAMERLASAQSSLDSERYYSAATLSFQGHIWIGHAERLADFFRADRERGMILAGIEDCRGLADDAVELASDLQADDMTSLYAYGAAQGRARHATELLGQAEALAARGRIQDLADALFQVSFCVERVDTVQWWAGLADRAPRDDSIDAGLLWNQMEARATELVSYAEAVLGAAPDARADLERARTQWDSGWKPDAILLAIEAQVGASLAVQSTSPIADRIVAAARDSAAKAVAEARLQGVEPLLPVSMIELADDQDDNTLRLENYWTARNLALLASTDAPIPDARVVPQPVEDARAPLLMGMVLGAMVALAATALLLALPRQ